MTHRVHHALPLRHVVRVDDCSQGFWSHEPAACASDFPANMTCTPTGYMWNAGHCPLPPSPAACSLLTRRGVTSVLFVGDSYVRHAYEGVLLALSGDYDAGALVPNTTAHHPDCAGAGQFEEAVCRSHVKPSASVCGGTVAVALHHGHVPVPGEADAGWDVIVWGIGNHPIHLDWPSRRGINDAHVVSDEIFEPLCDADGGVSFMKTRKVGGGHLHAGATLYKGGVIDDATPAASVVKNATAPGAGTTFVDATPSVQAGLIDDDATAPPGAGAIFVNATSSVQAGLIDAHAGADHRPRVFWLGTHCRPEARHSDEQDVRVHRYAVESARKIMHVCRVPTIDTYTLTSQLVRFFPEDAAQLSWDGTHWAREINLIKAGLILRAIGDG